jgi:ribosome-associated protein
LEYSRSLSNLAAQLADEKKAKAIVLLDLEEVSTMADYFVLCNGSTPIQVRAIAEHIEDKLSEAGYKLYHVEGMSQGRWVLLDFGVVVIHVMLDREREFYGLERLWAGGRMLPYQAAASA